MDKTKIDWCDSTWNPVTGCRHNCPYCYARDMVKRFGCGDGSDTDVFVLNSPYKKPDINCLTGEMVYGKAEPYPYGFSPTLHRYRLNDYVDKKKGRNIFVCSMADLFGEWVSNSWIEEVFAACRKSPQHNYLFLTKDYMRASNLKFEKNWWIGRTYTHTEQCNNVDKNMYLCNGDPWSIDITERANQFLSIEPLLGEVTDLPYYAHEYGYKWVIVGAETGRRKNKVIPKREWIEKIVEDCKFRNVPVFMKSSLADVWGEPLIQEFPDGLKNKTI